MSDVLNRGIFNIENLHLKRKSYPNYSVIYFVSPCKESIEAIVNDFKDRNDPTYGNVHIHFSSRVLDTNLASLATENLAHRIKSLKELNVSFFCKNNLYDFRIPNSMQIFALQGNNSNTQRRSMLNKLKDDLMTVIVSMKEFPYIQYQDSKLCSEFASMVNGNLHELEELKLLNNERKSILLILDRSFDVVTPVLHDYSYKSIIHDFFQVDSDGVLNVPSESISNYKLDEKDEIWTKFKNIHIGEVLKNIQDDVEKFKESDLAKNNSGNMDNFDDMIKAVQGVAGYREKHKQLNIHLKICNKILKVSFF
jgi:syntaxin-binding protein 1